MLSICIVSETKIQLLAHVDLALKELSENLKYSWLQFSKFNSDATHHVNPLLIMYSESHLSTIVSIFNHIVLMDLGCNIPAGSKNIQVLACFAEWGDRNKTCRLWKCVYYLCGKNVKQELTFTAVHSYSFRYSSIWNTKLNALGFTTTRSQSWMLQQ